MAQIHKKKLRDMCFIHKCRSTELNMHLDLTGPLRITEFEHDGV